MLPVLLPGKAAPWPWTCCQGDAALNPRQRIPFAPYRQLCSSVLWEMPWHCSGTPPLAACDSVPCQSVAETQAAACGGGKIKKAVKWIRYRRGKAYEAMLGFQKFSSACCSWQVSFSCGIREGLSLPAGATAQLFSWSGLQPFADHRYYPTSGCINNYCTWKLRRFLPRESFVQINTSSVRFCSSLWKLQRLLKLGLPAVYQFSGWRHSREYVRQATHVSCFFGCRRKKL